MQKYPAANQHNFNYQAKKCAPLQERACQKLVKQPDFRVVGQTDMEWHGLENQDKIRDFYWNEGMRLGAIRFLDE